jgi:phenylalanyl-tRNA synthetase beta chain
MAISMKTSPKWLQSFFDQPLPSAEEIGDALTFHSCEIEEITPNYIDVNVLPDRAGYCLCHRGIAYELSAILKMEMNDPLRVPLSEFKSTDALTIEIENLEKCSRYIGALVRGVKVGPSPDWLREALESVGQRSINNVVDATNYVMLNIGQPLHAFDAANLVTTDDERGNYAIKVRDAREGEKIITLTGEEFTLSEGMILITDGNTDAGIGIGGVKGGKAAAITDATTDIIIESANFDGSLVRKTSQKLKLWTDASQRYQNKPSPELTAYGMRAVLALIQEVAGGELEGVVDTKQQGGNEIKTPAQLAPIVVTLEKINSVLGSEYTLAHVANVFESLDFAYLNEGNVFTVRPPFERRDILIAEDLIEEVGRIIGYDSLPPVQLPPLEGAVDQTKYRGIEHIKDFLTGHGFSEISTQTFATEGDITLENPLDQTKPALRNSLAVNMIDALARAKNVAPLVLGPAKELKLFEIGTVFTLRSEHLSLVLGYDQLIGKKSLAVIDEIVEQLRDFLPELMPEAVKRTDLIAEISLENLDFAMLAQTSDEDDSAPAENVFDVYQPEKILLGEYKPFSIYPFALRDIAVWTPSAFTESEVQNEIEREAGELLARIDLFDRFEKKNEDGTSRISYAFRLVFESSERTLSDEDLNPIMDRVTAALNTKEGFEVR